MMKRERLAGYRVSIDEERGTFTIRYAWWKNVGDLVGKVAFCVLCGTAGVACLASPWNATPGVPYFLWRWYDALAFGALAIVTFLMGALFLGFALRLLYDVVTRALHGFPPVLLDRAHAKYRDSSGSVFRIDGLDSIRIAEKDGGEGGIYYALDFQFRDGKPRQLDRSFASTRASCEALGSAVARFLNVPIQRT